MYKLVYFLLFSAIIITPVFSQEITTDKPIVVIDTAKTKKHSPKKAAILSAILPGAGQIYNKKNWYWKTPVIIAGFGILGYLAQQNWANHKHFKNAYIVRTDTLDYTYDIYDETSPFIKTGDIIRSEEALLSIQESYRKDFELTVICLTLWFVLNILDASVEAHLFNFDVSSDLSLQWSPDIRMQAQNPQLGLKLNIRL